MDSAVGDYVGYNGLSGYIRFIGELAGKQGLPASMRRGAQRFD
jgi:hypothetical protein